MISQFANEQKVRDVFALVPELERFAFEFCKAFNCKVTERNNTNLGVVTEDGVVVGALSFNSTGGFDKSTGKSIPTYQYFDIFAEHTKRERSSIKIKSLISAVKKAGLEPTDEKAKKSYARAIRYGFDALGRGREPDLPLIHSEKLFLIKQYLKLDTNEVSVYASAIQAKYNEYQNQLRQYMEMQSESMRFKRGVHAVLWCKNNSNAPYYIVTEAGIEKDEVVFQAPLKRYLTLRDVPQIAQDVPLIRAWAEGKDFFESNNELGLPVRDTYHSEIDVACGYTHNNDGGWFLIPKEAP